MTHVLVVDDEPHLLRALTMNLAGRGYEVSTAATGRAALDVVRQTPPDVVILDLGLPDRDGIDVLRLIRDGHRQLPVLILSARTGSPEIVTALELGANDYVTKPFDMNELVARLRAALRRVEPASADPIVQLGAVAVDLAARTVDRTDDGQPPAHVHLTPNEWRMLDALLRRPGMLTTPTDLLTAMRGDPHHTDRSYLRIYMQQLRRKLEADPSRPRFLLTEPGLGYRYVP